ncbi:hypothetical protein WT83_04965 [Burkholderia territorii]|uniref:Uncharacterized protein n=2 Tax=Burkholderia territorii TaxID=1503055 RepID=A0A125K934_9BURK|nr:hypothetical protein WT83_04965 [Burkholderia territorii]
MIFRNYLYIFCAPGMDATVTCVDLHGSNGFLTQIIGVASTAEASAAAVAGVTRGAQVVELCGAFGPDEISQVKAAVGDGVPVGAVTFALDQLDALNRIFS